MSAPIIISIAISIIGALFGMVATVLSWNGRREVGRTDKLEAQNIERVRENAVLGERLANLKERLDKAPNLNSLADAVREGNEPLRSDLQEIRRTIHDHGGRLIAIETRHEIQQGGAT